MQDQPSLPVLSCGDLHGDLGSFALLESLLDQRVFVDIGKSRFSDDTTLDEPTCKPYNSDQLFRRDYMLATPDLFSLISDFRV
eukprot:5959806-Karenia_brevis.AAC.1